MTSLTLQLPDALAHSLQGIALAEQCSVEKVVVERLGSMLVTATSPQALLAALRGLPHPSADAVDELEVAITADRTPVHDAGVFDRN
jgi:hypothetical protein